MKPRFLVLFFGLIAPLSAGSVLPVLLPAQPPAIAIPAPPAAPAHSKDYHIMEVIKKEGGYQNHPLDRGNRGIGTKYGITPATYKIYTGKAATTAALKALTKEQAADIYRQMWAQSNMDLLPPEVAGCVFDFYINTPLTCMQVVEYITGTSGSAKALSISANAAAAIAAMPHLCATLKDARAHYFQYRAAKYNQSHWHRFYRKMGKTGSPNNQQFLRGWLARIQ